MTELKGDAKITRKVQTTDRHGRQLVVTLHGRYLEIRPYKAHGGPVEKYSISYDAVWLEAARIAAMREREERAAARAAKRKAGAR
jgi:hypothetical protein